MALNPVMVRTVQSTTGMAIQGVARFAYTLVIGRLAGPETLGEVTAVLSLAVYLGLVWPAGASTAATRYYASPEIAGQGAHAIRRTWLTGTLVLSILMVPLTYWATGDVALCATSALLMFSYSAYMFTRGELTGEDRLGWAVVADALSSVLALSALVVTTFFHLSWALLLPLSLGYLLFAGLSRSGTRSTFGEVRVYRAGGKDPIAVQRAIAVYTELNSRHVTIPIAETFKGSVEGPVTVQYFETFEDGVEKVAETQAVLR